ncbi:MAG: hypothetical protein ACK4SY_01190 [Pyrobaculum sp.]
MREFEKTIELIKRSGAGVVKYVKYGQTEVGTYYIKIFLLKPIDIKIVFDVIKEFEKGYSIKIYAPHARAIRLDLKKK